MMADPVAQEGIGIVGAVLNTGKAPLLQEGFHLLPGDGEHGANDSAADRGDPAQAPQTGAPDQMEQQGLRIVICRVGRGDFSRQGSQKAVPGLPGCCLQPLFPRLHQAAAQVQGDVIAGTEILHKGRIPLGFRPPEVVIEVGCFQLKGEFILQQIQTKQQRHRICSTGDGADHPVAGPDQPFPPDEVGDFIQHVSTPGRQRSGTEGSTGASPFRFPRDGSCPRCTRQCPCPRN